MHHLDLILTLTGGLAAALVCGYLTHRLTLAHRGVSSGWDCCRSLHPGFVANRALAEQLAEVGVILLMFGVGLQFHLKELLAVRRVALPGAIVQSALATGLGAVVARAFGWSWAAGLVFGLALSVASTVVLMRVLTDNSDLHTNRPHRGRLVGSRRPLHRPRAGVVASSGRQPAGRAEPCAAGPWTGGAEGRCSGGLHLLVGGRLIPWLLERVAATHSRELFTYCPGTGPWHCGGLSHAIRGPHWALAGMVVGRSDFSLRAASDALPCAMPSPFCSSSPWACC